EYRSRVRSGASWSRLAFLVRGAEPRPPAVGVPASERDRRGRIAGAFPDPTTLRTPRASPGTGVRDARPWPRPGGIGARAAGRPSFIRVSYLVSSIVSTEVNCMSSGLPVGVRDGDDEPIQPDRDRRGSVIAVSSHS